MRSLLRRLRGALGNALTWSVTWFVGAVMLSPLIVWATPWSVLRFVVSMPWLGALAGVGFSVYLGAVARRTLLPDLRSGRIALGAGSVMGMATLAIGVAVSALSGNPLPWVGASALALFVGTLSGASALASVRLAQGAIESEGPSSPQLTS